jgi:hypothetical protein
MVIKIKNYGVAVKVELPEDTDGEQLMYALVGALMSVGWAEQTILNIMREYCDENIRD